MEKYNNLIEKQRELIKYYEDKLSMGEIHSAWGIKSEISTIEKEIEEEEKKEDYYKIIPKDENQ